MNKTIVLLLLFCCCSAAAQTTYQGVVTDAETNEPLEMATVRLVKGSYEQLISYAHTDNKGSFAIIPEENIDSLYIIVSILGYKTTKRVALSQKSMQIQMQPEAISLREVLIKPGRVSGRRDTINYSLGDFISSQDESMKDVLKKLPGINVDNNSGKISYNGKDISKFYIEGMDLTDGRYNQINNNLQAKAVDVVQVLENHQPVRMLKEKINSEEVAINLKLKPEFRDKWMVSLQGGVGYSANKEEELLQQINLNALQLSRKSQSVYAYKHNNNGNDITTENNRLTLNTSDRISESSIPGFLSQPTLSAPLKQERLLFNDVHTLSGNRLYKVGETTQLRINAAYTHDARRQKRGSETTYYQSEDTIRIAEESNSHIRSNKGEVGLHLENNTEKYFLTNRLNLLGEWEKGNTAYSGKQNSSQQIQTTSIGIKNELKSIWNKGNATLEAASLVRYYHLPSELRVKEREMKQRISLNHFYTHNYFAWLKKKGYFTQRYTTGITLQGSNIGNSYSGYFTPYWQYNTGKWRSSLSAPLTLTKYTKRGFAQANTSPTFYLHYRYNYAWQFSLTGSYRESYGDLTTLYTTPYYTDYRHTVSNSGEVSINRNQYYSAYGEYKNTIKEFFATLSVSHQRGWSSHTYEEVITAEEVAAVSRKQSVRSETWNARGQLSKGFFDYNLKASLNYTFGWSRTERISSGLLLPVTSTYMFYEPKIAWTPGKLGIDYEGTFRYGGSKIGSNTKLTPLLNIVQKIILSYRISPSVELGCTADHYYNDVSSSKGVNAFLLDASAQWKPGSWTISLAANNLLDKQQYSYTQYSSLQSYSSWVNIRGREILILLGYRF
ncbi:TonB-dependent receptor [Bacteroides sp. 214]|uniref:carboxypeptidase-like regulatory domain-containing protein n=1 Tax=Bacteroides sp. 214 TaxID=2302935 RepID=UPI0013D3E3F6|nr:carboxypeptidase-like regulatory domain-containing protein [Bacteroides sp. 214]NDW11907.1 TonB-dependent receptor [Bacteroides sp. 214]